MEQSSCVDWLGCASSMVSQAWGHCTFSNVTKVGLTALTGACLSVRKELQEVTMVLARGEPVCARDEIYYNKATKNTEAAIERLRNEIRIGKEQAGIREQYEPTYLAWEREISALVELPPVGQAPTPASSQHDLVYSDIIAKKETDRLLGKLGKNAALFITLQYIFPDKTVGVDASELLDLIAHWEGLSRKEICRGYIDHFGKKWSWMTKQWVKMWFSLSFRVIEHTVQTAFHHIVEEVRLSTTGRAQPIFESCLVHLDKFLEDYAQRGEKPLDAFTNGKNLQDLCQELGPILVEEFFPRLDLSKVGGVGRYITWLNAPLTWVVKSILKGYMPTVLKDLSENVLLGLTAEKYSFNYRFVNPLVQFGNDKLVEFTELLRNPSSEIEIPPPASVAKKLEGVIDKLMALSGHEFKEKELQVGIRDGLIGGGYQLLKHLQKEPETLLQQLLILTNLPFTPAEKTFNEEEEERKFQQLCKQQKRVLSQACDLVFEQEVEKRIVGTPGHQVSYHLEHSHHELTRYIEEGLSDVIGLKSSMKKAMQGLEQNPEELVFDELIQKNFLFWERFEEKLNQATCEHYPKPATQLLLDHFQPVCVAARDCVHKTCKLQQSWRLYTRHRHLEKHFTQLVSLFQVKNKETGEVSLDLAKFNRMIGEIEILLPPHPIEVRMLKRFYERLSVFQFEEAFLRDLLELKSRLSLLQRKKGDPQELQEIQALIQKHPQKLAFLTDPTFLEKRSMIRDVALPKLERMCQEQAQLLKEEQLSFLYRIHPSQDKKALFDSLAGPLSFSVMLRECSRWIERTGQGYRKLKEENLQFLQKETKALLQDSEVLELEMKKIRIKKMHFPLEDLLAWMKQWTGNLGNIPIPYISAQKEALNQGLIAILEGIGPLIAAKKESNGKENLYSWIERVAMYEIIKYFNVKKRF